MLLPSTDWSSHTYIIREKKPEQQRKNLIPLAVGKGLACAWISLLFSARSAERSGGHSGNLQKVGRAIAQGPGSASLSRRRYASLIEAYFMLNRSLYEPPYTCPTAVIQAGETRTSLPWAKPKGTVVRLHFISDGQMWDFGGDSIVSRLTPVNLSVGAVYSIVARLRFLFICFLFSSFPFLPEFFISYSIVFIIR